jgi:hypothetical protein
MLRRVALVRTDDSEESGASFIRVTRIGELGTTLKTGVFWDVTPCGSCKNRRFGQIYRIHHHGDNNRRNGNNAEEWRLLGCYAVWIM